MKITKTDNSNTAFGSFYNNKFLLKGLKYASENGTIVAAGTTFFFSSIVRPAAILLTPDTSAKNRHYASAKSIASSFLDAGLSAAIFYPVSRAVDNITKAPKDYLKPETIKNLQRSSKTLDEAPAYNFIKQITKLSPEFLAILPKAIITAALIVPATKLLFNKNNKKKEAQNENCPKAVSFKGGGISARLSKTLAGVIDSEDVQKIALKRKDSNFFQHALNLKDVLVTACFAGFTALNKKMDKENKDALIYNAALSTALCVGGGYLLNNMLKGPAKKFEDNFIKANAADPNLYKYLNGMKVAKPIIILSSLYYILIPMISIFCADKMAKGGNKSAHEAKAICI